MNGLPFNPNATWHDGFQNVYTMLNLGVHPHAIDQALAIEIYKLTKPSSPKEFGEYEYKSTAAEEYQLAWRKEYKVACYRDARQMLDHMWMWGIFDFASMPTLEQHKNEIATVPEKLYACQMYFHFWFGDRKLLFGCSVNNTNKEQLRRREFRLDSEDKAILGKDRMKAEHEISDQYRDNEAFLRNGFGWTTPKFKSWNIPRSVDLCPPLAKAYFDNFHLFTPPIRSLGHRFSTIKALPKNTESNGISEPETEDLAERRGRQVRDIAYSLPFPLRDSTGMKRNRWEGLLPSPEYLQKHSKYNGLPNKKRRKVLQDHRRRMGGSPTPRSRNLADHPPTLLSQFNDEQEEDDGIIMGYPLHRT